MSPRNKNIAPGEARSENLQDQRTMTENTGATVADTDTELEFDDQLAQRCRESICPQCPELARERDEKLRTLADMENVKKRLQREKEDYCRFATQSVLGDLLPVLDTLDLALEHGQKVEGCGELTHGVEMTRKIFLDILGRHDMEPLGKPGEHFDPAWHEALGQQPHPDIEPGRICQLVQKGYRLKGRLLRPAKVLVSQDCKQ